MKKNYSWMAAAALALPLVLSACSSEKDEPLPEPAAPEMITFGFNAAQNPEVLAADCEGTVSQTDKTVKVTLPAFADKSSLVAYFTVAEGNTVTVNGVSQESGVTANDFSAPVDYIVSNSDGSKNARYTVSVEKAANYAWAEVARYNEIVPRGDNSIMRINPDGVPYFGFVIKGATSPENKVVGMKYENNAFAYLGSNAGEGGEVASGRFDFNLSATGTPYFIYGDNSVTDPVKASATVMKYNGSAWENVGQAGICNFVPSKMQVGVVGDKVVAPLLVNATRGDYLKREAYGFVYGGSWAGSQISAGAALVSMAATADAAYVYTVGYPSYAYSVNMYKNGAWASLRNEYLEAGASQTGSLMADAASIAVAPDGSVYVLTCDDAETGDVKNMKFRIVKYSPDTQEWSLVGGSTLTSINADDSHISAKIAVAPDGTLFFAYCDYKTDRFARVQYFDNETKQWTAPEAISSEKATSISIGFCENGEAYISYVAVDTHEIVLQKYAAK